MSGRASLLSQEAAADEERRAILDILEAQAAAKSQRRASSTQPRRSGSPMVSPRSPMRAMLEADDPSPPRRPPSIQESSGTGSRPPTQRGQRYRSLFDDIESPSPASPLQAPAKPASIAESTTDSIYSSPPVPCSPRATPGNVRAPDSGTRLSWSHQSNLAEYQFGDIITAQTGQAAPGMKRIQHSPMPPPSSPIVPTSEAAGRHASSGGGQRHGSHSRSPRRASHRNASPQPLSTVREGRPTANLLQLDSGEVIDITKAYKKLSDASLLASGGSLAQLAAQKVRTREDGDGRLVKAYVGPDGETLDDSSSEEWSSAEDESRRGRPTSRRRTPSSSDQVERPVREPRSLLAAAEAERKQISEYTYQSLVPGPNPELKVTDASGKTRQKSGVHPSTSYEKEVPGSSVNSANNSENELEKDEIRKAQQLAVKLTDIVSAPDSNRSVRIIYRGDYTNIVSAAKEEHKEPRKYLVATDLSEESSHAMEWAIGTVLRDGDTLVAMCCLADESLSDGVAAEDARTRDQNLGFGVGSVPNKSSSISLLTSTFGPASGTGADSGSNMSASESPAPSGRDRTPAEDERYRIVEEITAKVSRLLRRTKLQVRVVVEVLHCKNPKHIVNEVIDLVKPTLVVLGSRGRSAIKGVILGSFSNYLVTKSSVPVMVARKRLRKKYRKGLVRQVNVLSSPAGRSLASAKVD